MLSLDGTTLARLLPDCKNLYLYIIVCLATPNIFSAVVTLPSFALSGVEATDWFDKCGPLRPFKDDLRVQLLPL